jgi:hypothetical protein
MSKKSDDLEYRILDLNIKAGIAFTLATLTIILLVYLIANNGKI